MPFPFFAVGRIGGPAGCFRCRLFLMMLKTRLLLIPLCLSASACDKAKDFMDPTGRAYGKSAAPAAASGTASTAQTTPKPATPAPNAAPSTSSNSAAAPIRMPNAGRNLTAREAMGQVPAILFRDDQGTWMFRGGVARRASAVASIVDSAGKPWGIAVGDLDLDGSDDAVVLVRLDRKGADPRWELAYLRNEDGTLYNTQTIGLPGMAGYKDVSVQGSGVLLTPAEGGRNLIAGYSGGVLSLSTP